MESGVTTLRDIGRFGMFSAEVILCTVTPPYSIHALAKYIWQVTIRCILPVLAVVFPFGMVMALQGLSIFEMFGAQRLLSSLVSVAVFRELSPVLASVLVASQAGSSFAAELGAMRIKEELDATSVMAINPIRIHVAPRFLSVVIATPMLNLFGSLAGITGGFVTAVLLKGESGGVYWDNLWTLTQVSDLTGGIIKTAIFGELIGLISCYQGYHASGGAAGVGRAVNNTVVLSITTFIVVNYALTTALFGAIQ